MIIGKKILVPKNCLIFHFAFLIRFHFVRSRASVEQEKLVNTELVDENINPTNLGYLPYIILWRRKIT